MKRRVGVGIGIATGAAVLLLPAPAGAEDYQMDCTIAGAIETQLAATVTAGSPESPVPAGEAFTLPDLYVEVDPSVESEFRDGTLGILGQQVALGQARQDGPDRLHWGPQDVELTAPDQPGSHDIAPETFGVTWVTPEVPLPISCQFPAGAPIATVEVVEGDEPPGTTPTTVPPTTTTTGPDGDDDGEGQAPRPAMPIPRQPNFTG